jgi:hypothetical protein
MTNIGAGSSPESRSPELRSPAKMLGRSQHRPSPSPPQAERVRPLRLPAANRRKGDGCGESHVFSVLAFTDCAAALRHIAISALPPSHATRNRVTNRIAANLLKTNDWHTCYPKLKEGGRPSRFFARRRSIFQRSGRFPLAISESSPARAASDSLSGGII